LKYKSRESWGDIGTVSVLSPPQRLLLAMITISIIEIYFTTLYMADLGTRAEPLGEGAQTEIARSQPTKASAEERGVSVFHLCRCGSR
jgi:hypothetical protein